MLRVGLTGGIGAGKSTVASRLAELGAVVVDADAIAREVVRPGTEGLAEVVAAFGEGVLDADGALDRPALGRIVFGDDDLRARLNGILHPRIGARTGEIVAAAPDDAVVVHDVPLLVENGMGPAFALVVVVDAPEDVRVERLTSSRDLTADDARSRIRAQATTEARREAADVWIDNTGDPAGVRDVVTALWRDRIAPYETGVRVGRTVPLPDALVDPDPGWEREGRRLAARAALAGGDAVSDAHHVGPTAVPGLAAPDVVDVLVRLAEGNDPDDRALSDALARAGFPPVGPGLHAGADPARPVRVLLHPAASAVARDLLDARDAARAGAGADDPDAVRAAVDVRRAPGSR